MLLDEKGRLWGKVSVVDLLIGAAILSLLGVARFGGAVVRHRSLAIYRVRPEIIIPSAVKMISVQGTGFSKGCKIQFGHLAEQPAHIVNEAVLEVDAPEGLDPGYFGVRVRNPSGRFAELPNGIQIRWDPLLERVEPKRTYPGEQVELYGRYFDVHARLRLDDIPLTPMVRESWEHLPMKIESDRPIPPGVYDVTVSNPGGGTQTLRRAIEILPRPRVTRVYPELVTYGEKVVLTIEGENLPKDAVPYLSEKGLRLANPVWISPQRMKALLEVEPGLSDWYGLILQIPDGPKILVKPRAIRVMSRVPMTFLVNLNVQGATPDVLEALHQMPESRLADQMKNVPLQPASQKKPLKEQVNSDLEGLWVVLRGQCQLDNTGKGRIFLYRGKPLAVGTRVTLNPFGRELTGTVLEQPIPINAEDE